MAQETLRMGIWILGFCALLTNLLVFVWRCSSATERSQVSSFLIIHLSAADFLMGLYLIIIASADVYYKDDYFLHADEWRRSGLCQVAGFLAMLSSEMSVFMLTLIPVDRVLRIVFTFKVTAMTLRRAKIATTCGWLSFLILSSLPLHQLDYFGGYTFFGRTGVCLPVHLNSHRLPGWEYSTFIFIAVNLSAFLIIVVGYLSIYVTTRIAKAKLKNSAGQPTSQVDVALARKLTAIVITNSLCWIPIIGLSISSLSGMQVSAWIAVFMLPLNAAANPILYTFSSVDCSKKSPLMRNQTRVGTINA